MRLAGLRRDPGDSWARLRIVPTDGPVATLVLGLVKIPVRFADQGFRVGAVIVEAGHANTDSRTQTFPAQLFVVFQEYVRLDTGAQAFRQQRGFRRPGVGRDDEKLFAAITRQQVGIAHQLLQERPAGSCRVILRTTARETSSMMQPISTRLLETNDDKTYLYVFNNALAIPKA